MFKKAAVFTDIHFGLKSNSRTHNQDCEDFVDWFIETAQKNECDTGIFCGDWHHNRNSLNLTTLGATLRSLEKLGKAFKEFYIFTGNHDLYYKDKRDVASTEFAKHIEGVTLVNEYVEYDGIALVPWLVQDEWRKIPESKAQYMFGHFELPSFYMNAMVKMPEHGDLRAEHFKNQEYVFSGHFHKRQKQGKIHYIGNAFPHNYADAGDDARGMMIIDRDKDKPKYINWKDCPKYRNTTLSKLLDPNLKLAGDKTYCRVTIDLPISFEEAQFIKETYISQFGCREITLIPQKQIEEITTELDISAFESVDEIVAKEIEAIDSDTFNKGTLLNIYRDL